MVDDSLAIEYENGVADVLAFLAADSAVVERNVQIPGRFSKTSRQIDIRLSGRIFGLSSNATMIVDCKRWAKPIDVADAGKFVDLVEDVGAELGLLVSTLGASKAARTRLDAARGTRIEVMALEELAAWRPPGTFETLYRVPLAQKPIAERVLRRAGFRVIPGTEPRLADNEAGLKVFRHYGTTRPSAESQQGSWDEARKALAKAGIGPLEILSHGIVSQGGTPGHRWLEIIVGGEPIGLKIIAATEGEVTVQLQHIWENLFRMPGDPPLGTLDVIRPEGWPVNSIFGVATF